MKEPIDWQQLIADEVNKGPKSPPRVFTFDELADIGESQKRLQKLRESINKPSGDGDELPF